MTQHLFIQPLDVWLFRNGKPFNRGSDHRAETVFPPLPTVIQGAIRSHYIELYGGILAYLDNQSGQVEERVGEKGQPPPASFQIQGPFLADCREDQVRCYARLPAHAYLDGDTYRLLEPKKAEEAGVITNLEENYQLLWRRPQVKPSKGDGGGWLSLANLHTLLQEGELYSSAVKPESHFLERESRLGIQLNDQTRTTETGMLYQADFVRLKEGYGLYVGVDGLDDLPTNGVMGLGGESRAAIYKIVSGPTWSSLPVVKNGFIVTFLTPTYFEKGWQPTDWHKFLDNSVECVAAAVGKPLVLGGFDLAYKKHKPSRRYVPAGSTYFFTGTSASMPATICDDTTEFNNTFNPGQIGFGQYILGGW